LVTNPLAASEPTAPSLEAQAATCLRAIAGEDAVLKPEQWEAISALVAERRRALVVQRTGFGKSAVYFVATSLLRSQGAGPTVIVSPLLSLMRNQIEAAERAGLKAATVNSTNPEEWGEIYGRINHGDIDLLLLSPERLNNPGFRENVMRELAASAGMLVVDEAHCISDWGHDFRPDYRRLRTLLEELPAGIPVLATTATANSRVVDDVALVLGLGAHDDVLVQRGPLDRKSLHLSVVRLETAAERLAWIADALDQLEGSGIIYTLTVAATEEVAHYLRSEGHHVLAYSGRTDDADRRAAESALRENSVKALVATSALGMGYDHPTLRFVINLGAPPSPVAYYQQVGRAGRATDSAQVILLPTSEDRAIWDYFASLAFPAQSVIEHLLGTLAEAEGPLSTPGLEPRVDLTRSRLEATLKVLDVDGAVRKVQGGWVATGQSWHYDAERYAKVAEVRALEAQAMVTYARTTECRMRFLLEHLDDPHATDCGRCDNCTGERPATKISDARRATAQRQLSQAGVALEPHKMWPTALSAIDIDLSGRIAADESAEVGRALARFSDLGYGKAVRAACGPGTQDAEVAEILVRAVVDVLSAWRAEWTERPSGIVTVGSHTHPRLIASLAEAIGGIGKLPVLGEAQHTGPSATGPRTNSAQRVRALHDAFELDDSLRTALRGPLAGRSVFLLDDVSASGWTLSLVSRLLRRAGAGAVYPLVLGIAA
jgi:ATP-dependent DNA helicase RecQ